MPLCNVLTERRRLSIPARHAANTYPFHLMVADAQLAYRSILRLAHLFPCFILYLVSNLACLCSSPSKSLVRLVTLLLHHVAFCECSILICIHCLMYFFIRLSMLFLFLSVVHLKKRQNVSSSAFSVQRSNFN